MHNKVTLYKGYHSEESLKRFKTAWQNNETIIFCPPNLSTFEFIDLLPPGVLSLHGELWSTQELKTWNNYVIKNDTSYKINPIAGVFTSGTSEEQKLVLYSKENIYTSLKGIFSLFPGTFNKIFCYPQPFHTFGLTLGYGAAVVYNCELLFEIGKYNRASHKKWLEFVDETTITLGTPVHFYDLVESTEHNKVPESYGAIIGGAIVKKDLWFMLRDKLNIRLPSIGYGATEASPGVTHLPPGQEPQQDGEIGYPLKHMGVKLIPDVGLEFSGPSLCMAYIYNNQLIFPEFHLLADLITIRKSDQVWIYESRSNWVVNRGGLKIHLEKLDKLLEMRLGTEVTSCAIRDQRLGQEVGVIYSGNILGAKEKIAQVAIKEFNFKINPKLILPVSKIPLNENFKKDRIEATKIITNRGVLK